MLWSTEQSCLKVIQISQLTITQTNYIFSLLLDLEFQGLLIYHLKRLCFQLYLSELKNIWLKSGYFGQFCWLCYRQSSIPTQNGILKYRAKFPCKPKNNEFFQYNIYRRFSKIISIFYHHLGNTICIKKKFHHFEIQYCDRNLYKFSPKNVCIMDIWLHIWITPFAFFKLAFF